MIAIRIAARACQTETPAEVQFRLFQPPGLQGEQVALARLPILAMTAMPMHFAIY